MFSRYVSPNVIMNCQLSYVAAGAVQNPSVETLCRFESQMLFSEKPLTPMSVVKKTANAVHHDTCDQLPMKHSHLYSV